MESCPVPGRDNNIWVRPGGVREIVGHERYDTPEAIARLNQVYACLDPYVNLFLPMHKVIAKERCGGRLRKRYDAARIPFERLRETGTLTLKAQVVFQHQLKTLNPLALHRQLEELLNRGPTPASVPKAAHLKQEVVQG